MPSVVPVSSKGWIVIPKRLRDRYNIQPGGKVMLSEVEGSLKIMPLPKDPVQDFRGILKGTSLLTELLDSRKEDNAREELRIGQLRDVGLLPK
ncbi:MAG: AbrB/MazE/SpoVT family DNA-binding domain-containing protein [Thermacetogeniaceae bacterium]